MCEGILKISDSFDAPATGEDELEKAGAPGTKYFTLAALSEGDCYFKMAYARGWEFNWADEKSHVNIRLIQIPISVAN